jgi:hypothetical protein
MKKNLYPVFFFLFLFLFDIDVFKITLIYRVYHKGLTT